MELGMHLKRSKILTAEEIITALSLIIKSPRAVSYPISIDNDISFITGVHKLISEGNALTTKQGYVAFKLAKKYCFLLDSIYDNVSVDDVYLACDKKEYLKPPIVKRPIPREVRFIPPDILIFRCPFTPAFQKHIRQIKRSVVDNRYAPIYIPEDSNGEKINLWAIRVCFDKNYGNYFKIFDIIDSLEFGICEETRSFLNNIAEMDKTKLAIAELDDGKINVVANALEETYLVTHLFG